MSQQFAIAGIGAILLDTVMTVRHYPPERGVETQAIEAHEGLGGPVVTALAFIRHLGVTDIRFMGAIGNDMCAKGCEEKLNETHLPKDFLHRQSQGTTSNAQVLIDKETGLRTIVYHTKGLKKIPPEFVTPKFLENISVLHLDAREPEAAKAAVSLIKEREVLISIDTGDWKPQTEELLQLANIVVSPKRCAVKLTGQEDLSLATETICKKYGVKKIVVVTDGKNGCAYSTPEEAVSVPAFPVTAFDTNGAGDIFSGGLLFALINHLPEKESVIFASAAAAIKCTKEGKYFPSQEEILAFLNQKIDKIILDKIKRFFV